MILPELKKSVILYILCGFGLFYDVRGVKISSKQFLIDKNIIINDNDKKLVYACEAKVGESLFKIIFTDISEDENSSDFAFVIKYSDGPYYSFYLYNNYEDKSDFDKNDVLILQYGNNIFSECSVAAFSSVLSGIEQLKDLPINWAVNQSYNDMYEVLVKLIEYREGLLHDQF